MPSILSLLRKTTAAFLALFLCIGITAGTPASFSALDGDNLKLNVSIFSDVHMESNCQPRWDILVKCLNSLKGSENKIDALAMVGDNTMNGQDIENLFFYGLLSVRCPVDTYLPAIGNHDVGNGEGDFSELQKRSINYLKAFVDEDISTTYYSKVINGYYLIFMGPDASESNGRTLSAAQLDWLEATLAKAAATGLPIFIFNHHPASSVTEGGDRYRSLVTKYPNTFIFAGHMHYYIHTSLVYGDYTTPEIWIPCLSMMGENFSVYDKTGLGYQLEVYPDKVCIRGRNYYAGTWTDAQEEYVLK